MSDSRELCRELVRTSETEIAEIRARILDNRARHAKTIDGALCFQGVDPDAFRQTERELFAALDSATRTFYSRLEELASA